jgi:hypothetical protein
MHFEANATQIGVDRKTPASFGGDPQTLGADTAILNLQPLSERRDAARVSALNI